VHSINKFEGDRA